MDFVDRIWGGYPKDARRVLRLVLRDSTQHCYINSFALAWIWAFSLLQAPDAHFFGDYSQAWRDVLYSSAPITIYRAASWSRLLRGWQAPSTQHDVADFITYINTRMPPLILQGEWQSRSGIGMGQAVVNNSGQLFSPILLHPTGDGRDELPEPVAHAGLSSWSQGGLPCAACAAGQIRLRGFRSSQRSLGGCDSSQSFHTCIRPKPQNISSDLHRVFHYSASWSLHNCWTLHFIAPGAGRPAEEQILGN